MIDPEDLIVKYEEDNNCKMTDKEKSWFLKGAYYLAKDIANNL